MAADYDLVINDGRVMDPETNFDGIRNVGIKDGKIAVITEDKITGKETIDIVNGMVVVKNSEVLKDVFPGQPIRYPVESEGRYQPLNVKEWVDNSMRNRSLGTMKALWRTGHGRTIDATRTSR